MTKKECMNNPLRIGDFVKVTKGGSSESKSLIWLVVDVFEAFGKPTVTIRLVDGTYTLYGKKCEVGFERRINMGSLKKIDVIVSEKGM